MDPYCSTGFEKDYVIYYADSEARQRNIFAIKERRQPFPVAIPGRIVPELRETGIDAQELVCPPGESFIRLKRAGYGCWQFSMGEGI